MNSKYMITTFIILIFFGRTAQAQQSGSAGSSDTLIVMWTSGDPEVAEKACLMYTHAAKKYKWFKEVILIVWGPSQKLVAENALIKEKVAAMQKDGVIVQACIACSNMYRLTDELKACGIDVKGMGVPLSGYLKRGCSVLTY